MELYIKFSNINFNFGYTKTIDNSKSIMDMLKIIYVTLIGSNYGVNTSFQTFFTISWISHITQIYHLE